MGGGVGGGGGGGCRCVLIIITMNFKCLIVTGPFKEILLYLFYPKTSHNKPLAPHRISKVSLVSMSPILS